MSAPWRPEDADLVLSCYLDGELGAATRLEVEAWLRGDEPARARLEAFRQAQAALAAFRAASPIPPGWTARAYRLGLPDTLPPGRRMAFEAWGLRQARPLARGHALKVRRCKGRRRIRINRHP